MTDNQDIETKRKESKKQIENIDKRHKKTNKKLTGLYIFGAVTSASLVVAGIACAATGVGIPATMACFASAYATSGVTGVLPSSVSDVLYNSESQKKQSEQLTKEEELRKSADVEKEKAKEAGKEIERTRFDKKERNIKTGISAAVGASHAVGMALCIAGAIATATGFGAAIGVPLMIAGGAIGFGAPMSGLVANSVSKKVLKKKRQELENKLAQDDYEYKEPEKKQIIATVKNKAKNAKKSVENFGAKANTGLQQASNSVQKIVQEGKRKLSKAQSEIKRKLEQSNGEIGK